MSNYPDNVNEVDAPWREVTNHDMSEAYHECVRWLRDSALPFVLLARKEMDVCSNMKSVRGNMTGIIDLAREHAYEGARGECLHIDQEVFDDAWQEAVSQILAVE